MPKKGTFNPFCKRGHDRRVVGVTKGRTCKECHKLAQDAYVRRDPKRAKAIYLKWIDQHRDEEAIRAKEYRANLTPEQRQERAAQQRQYDEIRKGKDRHTSANNIVRGKRYRERHPDRVLHRVLRRDYGLGLDEYRQLFAAQKGLCAICLQPERMKLRGKIARLSVDHDHETSVTRGLLCTKCNRGLGLFEDDLARLFSAIRYLSRHRAVEEVG